jgi:Major Facilitator Superfamily
VIAAAPRHRGPAARAAERHLLGRFYAAEFIGYALDVVLPFQFVYLYLVLDWSEWATLPFVVYSATFMFLELATGIWADRYGRKPLVLAGEAVTALALVSVPLAASLDGTGQLTAMCAAYVVMGLGESLRSGSQEAWVVDNLLSARRPDLLETYFVRTWSLTSAGGAVAGVLAVLLLFILPVSRELIDWLWVIAAASAVASALIVIGVPESSPPGDSTVVEMEVVSGRTEREDLALSVDAVTAGREVTGRDALRVIRRTAGLCTFLLAYGIASFSGGTTDEAFEIALVTRGLDARAFALLGIVTDVAGIMAPLAGLWLARRLGARRAMAILLLLPGVIVTVFLAGPGIGVLIAVAVLLDVCDMAWDPVARAHLHRTVPSRFRATVASAFEQAASFAELASLGLFAVLLGEQGRALREATPDLVEAFSGGGQAPAAVPTGLLGLPVPDLAILLFVATGLIAVPLLLRQEHRDRGAHSESRARSGDDRSAGHRREPRRRGAHRAGRRRDAATGSR